jgi:hypothetical protein
MISMELQLIIDNCIETIYISSQKTSSIKKCCLLCYEICRAASLFDVVQFTDFRRRNVYCIIYMWYIYCCYRPIGAYVELYKIPSFFSLILVIGLYIYTRDHSKLLWLNGPSTNKLINAAALCCTRFLRCLRYTSILRTNTHNLARASNYGTLRELLHM